jgi:hypothetical protein
MNTNKLIITGILGVVLSIVVMFSFAVFVAPTLHEQNLREYKSTDLAKQFQLTYPESGMVATTGTLYERNTSFTYFKNARHASLTFFESLDGQKIIYKCERIISSQEPVEIFYFEDPTPEIIKNNVCGEYD